MVRLDLSLDPEPHRAETTPERPAAIETLPTPQGFAEEIAKVADEKKALEELYARLVALTSLNVQHLERMSERVKTIEDLLEPNEQRQIERNARLNAFLREIRERWDRSAAEIVNQNRLAAVEAQITLAETVKAEMALFRRRAFQTLLAAVTLSGIALLVIVAGIRMIRG